MQMTEQATLLMTQPTCRRPALGAWAPLLFLLGAGAGVEASAAEFDCVTEPRQTVEIRSSVDGLIQRIDVDRGDIVKAGQVLASLESGLEKSSADLARFKAEMHGAVQSGENRLTYASIKASRREQLNQEHYVSAQDRDEAVGERHLAESQLVESKENKQLALLEYQRASEQLRLRTVVSPINGVIVERLMNPGELSDNHDQRRPILKIADVSVLYVETLLPLAALGKVRAGMEASVTPEAPIGGHYTAKVKVVDRVIDAASGTFGVRLELPNKALALPAGIKCRVAFADVAADAAMPPVATRRSN
jgi:RND family efflux transporter MFP subunit